MIALPAGMSTVNDMLTWLSTAIELSSGTARLQLRLEASSPEAWGFVKIVKTSLLN